ncbi:hypothetical protein llap_16741 [Limosa lapponica baueri]|uniref:Uncharacterized protein n=1 Tax=Limosa lapponica baueri TaxID=1758121 RepID=A0A2I0TGQ4_LIMLA|nr:hypothetical protein llap_16741 [Limosa lapponica baueri]
MSSNQLQLTWTSPYSKTHCLEHSVKCKSNKDTSWTVKAPTVVPGDKLCTLLHGNACPHCMAPTSLQEHWVNGDIFSFPSMDYEKFYTFYMCSKINSYCGTTQLWCEWSIPMVWAALTNTW